jgi:hypothetical protein
MTKIYSREHIKEWKKYHGEIPKDENGRSFEIHHRDGNTKNNFIENLQCVSIQEHYNIHLEQEDYGAAFLIARRMEVRPEIFSELARIATMKRIENGTHNFQDPNFNRSLYHNRGYVVAIDTRNGETVRIEKAVFEQNDFYVGVNKNRIQKTIHQNRGHNKNKTWKMKNKEVLKKCLYCDFIGRGSSLSRYHNEKCKMKGKL